MKYWMPLVIIACIAAALVTGCISSQGGVAQSASAPSPAGDYSAVKTANWYGTAQEQALVAVTSTSGLPGEGTDAKIIRTAEISIETANVTGAAGTLAGIATNAGGYVSSTSIYTDYNDRLTGTITLRVPADQFDSALSGVRAIGTVTSVSTRSQDVTAEYVDTDARITAYRNQIAQYNAIMKNATEIKDVLAIQQQIDTVQTELDRATGQMKYLTSRIDYATITVSLHEPEPVGGRGGHDFVAAINDGIAGFFGVIDGIIVLVLSILPIIVIGGLAYAGYRVWKKKQPAAAAPKEPEQKE